MRSLIRSGVALGLGLVLALQTSAGTRQFTLGEILSETKAVVHGVVVDQFSQWEEYDGHKIVFTYSTVRVHGADFRGISPSRHVVVRTVGGKVGDYQQVLVDEASFRLGEEVIVFLGVEDGWLHPSVVGFRQGKYGVTRDDSGRILGVRQDAGQQLEPSLAAPAPLIPLARFLEDLRRTRRNLAEGDTSDVHPLVPVR